MNIPRVLVVDDDEDLRMVLCEQLDRANYRTKGVGNGVEALMELEDQAWDVVLTDVKMPYMNGIDLLRIITTCWPDTSVIVMTGEPGAPPNLQSNDGAFAWIHKPYDLTHLLQTVHAAAQRTFELRVQMERGRKQGGNRW